MTEKLCPHMAVFFTNKGFYGCNCRYKSTVDDVLTRMCSLDFFDLSGTMFTTRDKVPEKAQESCPMHYSYEEISEKQTVFFKRIVKRLEQFK